MQLSGSIIKRLTETNDIREYLQILNVVKNEVVIILAVRDTPGNCMSEDILKSIKNLGFQSFSKELWRMYIGVNIANKKITDYLSNKAEEKLSYSTDIVGNKLEVKSEPWRNGNIAEIIINGKDYSQNLRGINIVVLNLDDNSVIDSIGYDSHYEQDCFERDKWARFKGKYFDICLVGVWYGLNYGSIINGYAEYKILQSLGKKVLMMQKPGAGKQDIELRPSNHNVKFIKKHYLIDDISPLYSINELEKFNDLVDGFCVGSDQIWNYPVSMKGVMYLPFVRKDKYRISYATSCGSSNDHVPDDKIFEVKKQLRQFNVISVRESSSAKVLKEKYGVSSEVLIDPVFTMDIVEYEKIIAESNIDTVGEGPYLLAYILDPTDEKFHFVNRICENLNLKLVIVPDGCFGILKCTWDKYDCSQIKKNLKQGVLVEDFLKLIHDASYIVTDSFHGTAFSVIFNKQFISICNPLRGKNRFYDLVERFSLENRLIDGSLNNINIEEYINFPISYTHINDIITAENKKSYEWLEYALDPSKQKDKNILKANVQYCTGCAACANICPTDAIEMKPNYDGFYNPSVDYDKCVNCGKCTEVCPALKISGGVLKSSNSAHPRCYEFITADEKLLWSSSSGGIFGELCRLAFARGGTVYGAAWKDDYSVEHIRIESEAELYRLQKSKYLQSYTGKIFRQVKADLEEGRFVLFSGTPCQVTGLKCYLGKDYDNLLLVDLLCGNAPSSIFFRKYLKDEFPEGVKKYEFRHKVDGWNADCVTVTVTVTDGRSLVRRGGVQDLYQRGYHNHLMCPPHCEHCVYQNAPRYGDITIGDFWGIQKYDSTVDVKKGISAVIINNEKGQVFFDTIPSAEIAVKKEVPVAWLGGNGFVNGGHNFIHPKRNVFFDEIRWKAFQAAEDAALKPALAQKINSKEGSVVSALTTHFSFDETIWEEHFVQGRTMLSVKPGKAQVGKYATIMIGRCLERGKKYHFEARVRFKSASDILNFHIKDSGTKAYQYFHTMKNDRKEDWKLVSADVVPQSNIFDQFMFGASQFTGEGNYLVIDYMMISEVKE